MPCFISTTEVRDMIPPLGEEEDPGATQVWLPTRLGPNPWLPAWKDSPRIAQGGGSRMMLIPTLPPSSVGTAGGFDV